MDVFYIRYKKIIIIIEDVKAWKPKDMDSIHEEDKIVVQLKITTILPSTIIATKYIKILYKIDLIESINQKIVQIL